MNDFILGVNYWPRKKAMYWWKDFDEREVETEFKQIKEIGFSHIRFFLLWEDFQPKINEINQKSLKNLDTVFEIAESLKLKLMPTFFTGHMSGVTWLPDWVLDGKLENFPYRTVSGGKVVNKCAKDIFCDIQMLEAENLLIEKVVSKFAKYPALHAWDLGNEHSQIPIKTDYKKINKWLKKIRGQIKNLDSKHPVTLGIHQLDVEKDTGFRPQVIGENCDLFSMHGYAVYAGWARNYLDPEVVPFLNTLVSSLSKQKVLFTEFGLQTNINGNVGQEIELSWSNEQKQKTYLATEEEQKEYIQKVILNLHKVGALGAFIWCFSDYVEDLWKLPPLDQAIQERSFGVTRNDGSLKPVADVIKEISLKATQNVPIMNVAKENYYQDPLSNLKRYFQGFLSHE